jgi:hypothetical protein
MLCRHYAKEAAGHEKAALNTFADLKRQEGKPDFGGTYDGTSADQ